MKKIILDLCGGTGAWSKPYKEAGYEVWNVTWPDYDVRMVSFQDNMFHLCSPYNKAIKNTIKISDIYGILAAPPCTQFSFARTRAKKQRNLQEGMDTVYACLDIIWRIQYRIKKDAQKYSPLKFWALENPYFGMLRWFLGKPSYIFEPWEFGDMYQKKTALWGYFREPKKNTWCNPIKLPKFDYLKSKQIHPEAFGKYDRQTRRAITPAGFAKAFMEANK